MCPPCYTASPACSCPKISERGIAWHLELPEEPLVIRPDAQQLEQALLNVAKDVPEAIGHGGNVWGRTTAQPPAAVLENDSPGLSSKVCQRPFTPFFSTKRDGQDIGLTLVRDVLLAHGYRFCLETNKDGRTAFNY